MVENNSTTFRCNICNKKYKDKSGLWYHNKKFHMNYNTLDNTLDNTLYDNNDNIVKNNTLDNTLDNTLYDYKEIIEKKMILNINVKNVIKILITTKIDGNMKKYVKLQKIMLIY